MPYYFAYYIGGILALIATIILFITVLPESKNGRLPPLLQRLHDLLNFKTLLLERILRVLYVLSTCAAILVGFFLLFSRIDYYYGYGSTALMGLALMVLGPIAIRITYEAAMLLIFAVKNLMEINRKMDCLPGGEPGSPQPEPHYLYCTQCGTRYDSNQGNCTQCGLR